MQSEEFQKKSHDLAVCPFCGGEAELRYSVFSKYETYARCKCCGARTMEFSSASSIDAKLKAIEAWNTRKPMDDIVERLEEVKAKPTELCYDVPLIESIIKIVKGEV